METLLAELSHHSKIMFFTINHAICEWFQLYGGDYSGAKENTRYALFKIELEHKKMLSDEQVDELFENIVSNQKDEFFNWPLNFEMPVIEDVKDFVYPNYCESKQQEFLRMVNEPDQEPMPLPHQLFFLAGSHRFYFDLKMKQAIDLEKTLSLILKIDRKVAFIREDISAAIGSQKNRIANAKRTASSSAGKGFKVQKRQKMYNVKTMQAALDEPDSAKKFHLFIGALGTKLGVTAKVAKAELKKMGYDKRNFEQLKTNIKNGKM